MRKRIVKLTGSDPIAPYSPAVVVGDLVFVAGQVGFDPEKKQFFGKDIISQTRGALENLKTVLDCAGTNLENVVRTTIYLTEIDDFEIVNQIYSTYFSDNPPARSCVQVVAIAHSALIEIEAIATIEKKFRFW